MRNKTLLAAIAAALLLSTTGTASASDPRLMNLVMPDATSIAGANVTNAKNTPFGQFVLTQMTASMNTELQAIVTATGFDPRQDVSEILAASSGSAANSAALLLALGNFQVSQITSAISAKSPQANIQQYGGATLVTLADAKGSYSLAFFGSNIAAAGDTASVKAAVDRSAGANSINAALAAQVQSLSTTNDVWAVTSNSAGAMLAGLISPPAARPASSATSGTPIAPAAASPLAGMTQMFNNITASSGGVQFGSTVQITGQAVTTDAASAKSMADVFTALVAIASMSGGQTTGGKNTQMAALAQLLQNLKVTASGATVNLAMNVPEAQLETLLNGLTAANAKSSTGAAARPVPGAPKAAITPAQQ